MEYFLLALKRYSDFDGRSRRKEYWMFVLFYMLIYYALLALTFVADFMAILSMIFALVMLVPSIAVAIRRMHDVGKSGWFVLIPIYNLILTLTEGEKGTNQYGPDPKSDGSEVENIGKDDLV